MEIVNVNLGARSYPIYIGSGILGETGKLLKRYTKKSRVVIVTNPTVARLYIEVIEGSLKAAGFEAEIIEIPDGEEYKTFKWAGRIFDKLVKLNIDRRTFMIALGGGVIGDMTGFVAATYLRGVPFIQIPTTLLAQVDSSVGGKTAVNHRKGKNLIGAFYQPRFVLIDVNTLKTLDKREVIAGVAEAVKYGVIRDEKLFRYLELHAEKILSFETKVLKHVIKRSCRIKADIVEADEREEGQRALLNFGHTLGHAIEAATNYKVYRHGEAVGLGMLFAASFSHDLGYCDATVVDRISKLVKRLGIDASFPQSEKAGVLRSMKLDKKTSGDEIDFVFAEAVGAAHVGRIPLRQCNEYLKRYSGLEV